MSAAVHFHGVDRTSEFLVLSCASEKAFDTEYFNYYLYNYDYIARHDSYLAQAINNYYVAFFRLDKTKFLLDLKAESSYFYIGFSRGDFPLVIPGWMGAWAVCSRNIKWNQAAIDKNMTTLFRAPKKYLKLRPDWRPPQLQDHYK